MSIQISPVILVFHLSNDNHIRVTLVVLSFSHTCHSNYHLTSIKDAICLISPIYAHYLTHITWWFHSLLLSYSHYLSFGQWTWARFTFFLFSISGWWLKLVIEWDRGAVFVYKSEKWNGEIIHSRNLLIQQWFNTVTSNWAKSPLLVSTRNSNLSGDYWLIEWLR